MSFENIEGIRVFKINSSIQEAIIDMVVDNSIPLIHVNGFSVEGTNLLDMAEKLYGKATCYAVSPDGELTGYWEV